MRAVDVFRRVAGVGERAALAPALDAAGHHPDQEHVSLGEVDGRGAEGRHQREGDAAELHTFDRGAHVMEATAAGYVPGS